MATLLKLLVLVVLFASAASNVSSQQVRSEVSDFFDTCGASVVVRGRERSGSSVEWDNGEADV
jgi:hypothetical protein